MRKFLVLIVSAFLLFALTLGVSAEELPQAQDITGETEISGTGYKSFGFLKDKKINSYGISSGNAAITLSNPDGMASLYIMLDVGYGEYIIRDNNNDKTITAGTYSFVHEFIDLEAGFGYKPTSITLEFANGAVSLSEIYIFTAGQTPDFVQKWEPPLDGKTDILLMASHSDDDQLYFAGLLPYYAGELDCAVQVAYLTDHRTTPNVRIHEMLNGLWTTGVENYPVFAFPYDFLTYDLNDCYNGYKYYGVSKDDLLSFAVEQFRRFKPQVVVGHDINGEYGHGMHRVYADIIMKGIEISNNPESFPESAQKYCVWDVPKTYLHLLTDNPIEINYDIPLDHFDGMTAFEVSQKLGFPCHVSQQKYLNFVYWINGYKGEITKATQIKDYNPCKFGLYRSTVGADVQKNDFLENIITYAEQERLELERLEQERLEQERLEQERLEQERLEQERLEQERLEQERLELERLEQERLEQERLEQERLLAEARKKQQIIAIGLSCVCLLAAIVTIIIVKNTRKKQLSERQ